MAQGTFAEPARSLWLDGDEIMLYIQQFSYKRIITATQGTKRPNLSKGSLRKYIKNNGVDDITLKDSISGEEMSLKGLVGSITLGGPSPIKPRWDATIRPAKVGDGFVVE